MGNSLCSFKGGGVKFMAYDPIMVRRLIEVDADVERVRAGISRAVDDPDLWADVGGKMENDLLTLYNLRLDLLAQLLA